MSYLSRGLTKMEGRVAVLNRPALADLLRTMPGRAPPFANDVEGNKPAANAKLYIEVRNCSPGVLFDELPCKCFLL